MARKKKIRGAKNKAAAAAEKQAEAERAALLKDLEESRQRRLAEEAEEQAAAEKEALQADLDEERERRLKEEAEEKRLEAEREKAAEEERKKMAEKDATKGPEAGPGFNEGAFFRGEGRTSKGQIKRVWGGTKGAATWAGGKAQAAGKGFLSGAGRAASWTGEKLTERSEKDKDRTIPFGMTIFLLVLGALSILIKYLVGFDRTATWLLAGIMAAIFIFAVHKNSFFDTLVAVAFAIDVVSLEMLTRLPGKLSLIGNFLILIKVAVWLVLAITLLILDWLEYKKEGKEMPVWANVMIIGALVVLVILIFPMFKVYTAQVKTYDEYVQVQASITKLKEEATAYVTKRVFPAYAEMYYGVSCTISQAENRENCILEKQAAYVCKPYLKEGQITEEYTQCKEAEMGLKTTAEGETDPLLKEPLKLEWVAGEEFGQKELYTIAPLLSAKLKISNPRRYELNLEAACYFYDAAKARNISGIISPIPSFTVKELTKDVEVVCSPQEVLEKDKRYQVIYKVTVRDLTTTSKLQKLFFKKAETSEDEAEIKRITANFPLASDKSRGATDLARLKFSFSQVDLADIGQMKVSTSIENLGGGQIIEVKKAEVDLMPPGIGSNDLAISQPCNLVVTGSKVSINPYVIILASKTAKEIAGNFCYLRLGENLRNPPDFFKAVEFWGELTYTYELKKEFLTPVIKEIPSGVPSV